MCIPSEGIVFYVLWGSECEVQVNTTASEDVTAPSFCLNQKTLCTGAVVCQLQVTEVFQHGK